MAAGDNRTTIIVAVIGLVSALGVAAISNYDKLFNKKETTAPSTLTVTEASPPSVSQKTPPTKSVAPEASYKRMDFGFNGCDVPFGELKTGVSEADMVRLATAAGVKGFAYQPSLKYGRLIIGDYPKGCRSPANLSWPLYLKAD